MTPLWAANPDATEIMKRNFYASKVTNIRREATMQLISANGQVRERKSVVLSKLQNNGIDSDVIIRFEKPEDIRGTVFLQIEHADGDDELWIRLPALRKTRRLVANNKKDSFVGSDFSYGDILLPKVESYHHSLLHEEAFEGIPCFVIESIPASDTVRETSGYGKKVSWIRKDNFFEVKVDYYDIDGQLLKTQLVDQIKEVDERQQRWIALKRDMFNHQSNHRTIMTVDSWQAGINLADDVFTTRSLEID